MTWRSTIFLLLLATAGCRQSSAPTVVSGQSSSSGWDIRYNAVLSLARRGSPKLSDDVVKDLFKEMLDEEQQLRNFRTKLKSGQETTDAVGARTAVLGALKALDNLKTKQPTVDLSSLKPAIEKLTSSPTPALAQEARKLLASLNAK